jgi:hypothetical protein
MRFPRLYIKNCSFKSDTVCYIIIAKYKGSFGEHNLAECLILHFTKNIWAISAGQKLTGRVLKCFSDVRLCYNQLN